MVEKKRERAVKRKKEGFISVEARMGISAARKVLEQPQYHSICQAGMRPETKEGRCCSCAPTTTGSYGEGSRLCEGDAGVRGRHKTQRGAYEKERDNHRCMLRYTVAGDGGLTA